MPVRVCSAAHCSGADNEINEICKGEGWPVGHPVLTRDGSGPCTCTCSCLALGTPVRLPDGKYDPIESFAVGDSVAACGLSLVWGASKVMFSQGTAGVSRQPYSVFVGYGGRSIVVTSDHLFLAASRQLVRADRVAPGDKLMSPDGSTVLVDKVAIGLFEGGFHHIATSVTSPGPDLDGRLLDTNGLISADYSTQLHARSGELGATLLDSTLNARPVVGSPRYVAAVGGGAGVQGANAVMWSGGGEKGTGAGIFTPAESLFTAVPDFACRFISDAEAAARIGEVITTWDDPLSKEWTESLLAYHRNFFPDVRFEFDWTDDTPNAYAWVSGGQRFVRILGGLVRHPALEIEGVGVVVAHELAHHYGGTPTFPHGLSCEGQADFYGVRNVMRKVWFGDQFFDMTDRGINQMAGFFGSPSDPVPPPGSSNCKHPAGACRIATYRAAVSLRSKPGCAV